VELPAGPLARGQAARPDVFAKANAEAALMFPEGKREIYSKLKLQGISNHRSTCASPATARAAARSSFGRTHIKTMDLYSAACAPCRTSGWRPAPRAGRRLGEHFHQKALQDALGIPRHIVPIAYLCIGYVSHFNDKPELEKAGWLPRLPIADLVYYDQWGRPMPSETNR
jgi:5,6-dimethylbenzimidazole synthase